MLTSEAKWFIAQLMSSDEVNSPTVDPIKALEAACKAAGSQSAWAEEHDFSATYVSQVLGGKSRPSGRMLAILGIERFEGFRPIQEDKDDGEGRTGRHQHQ